MNTSEARAQMRTQAVRGCTAEDLMAIHLTELGLHFVRQYAYSPPRKFRADFAVWWRWRCGRQEGCRLGDRLCLVEVQGGGKAWGKKCPLCGRPGRGAHGSIAGVKRDDERLYWAFRAGWHVLRFTPQQVESGEAKKLIAAALKEGT